MAPTKSTRAMNKPAANIKTATTTIIGEPPAGKALTRRAIQNMQNIQDQNVDAIQTRNAGKRKADNSPIKNEKIKRSALGNLTNNVKVMTIAQPQLAKDTNQKLIVKSSIPIRNSQNKITTRATARNATTKVLEETETTATKRNRNDEIISQDIIKEDSFNLPPPKAVKNQHNKPVRRISNEFNKTEESLYMSALEDVSSCESLRLSENFEAAKRRSTLLQQQQLKAKTEDIVTVEKLISSIDPVLPEHGPIPDGVVDFDNENWKDPFQVSNYAMDIFNYLKLREAEFAISDYMVKQVYLSKWMRSLLVDWMVEVQETFELNHETLYLAVKIVDLYLCRVVIHKDKLQLLGAAALFIACKFDERTPPLVDDFLYICDGAYKQDELIHMEMNTLRTINYDLGIPLSYRFLRRYARCAKVPMPTLTLARYILELSLMDYGIVSFSDSKVAAAALFIALRLHGIKTPWTAALEFYTGYKLIDFADIVQELNVGLYRKPKGTIKTIRNKYSHKIFHEVARVTLKTTEKLFENNLDLNTIEKSIKQDATTEES